MQTIVVSRRYGEIENRLILYGHFIAHALDTHRRVVNPSLGVNARYFEGTAHDVLARYPRQRALLKPTAFRYRVIHKITRTVEVFFKKMSWTDRWVATVSPPDDVAIDLEGEEWRDLVGSRPWIFANGVGFRSHRAFQRNAEAVREFFTPIASLAARVADLADRAQGDADLLIGIHIRQGDYADYLGGRYHYSQEVYAEAMEQMLELVRPASAAFLVCSDGPLDSETLPGRVTFGGDDHIVDLYALSKCDYLIGTVSTFGMWAAFYGNTPIYMMSDPKQPMSLAGFKTLAHPSRLFYLRDPDEHVNKRTTT